MAGCMEWESIAPPAQYRLGTVTLGGGDAMSGGEVERSEMVAVTRVGKVGRRWSSILRRPSRSGNDQGPRRS